MWLCLLLLLPFRRADKQDCHAIFIIVPCKEQHGPDSLLWALCEEIVCWMSLHSYYDSLWVSFIQEGLSSSSPSFPNW
jgi:hypothetical protein